MESRFAAKRFEANRFESASICSEAIRSVAILKRSDSQRSDSKAKRFESEAIPILTPIFPLSIPIPILKKQKIKCHRCPPALGTVAVEMQIPMAILPAAFLRHLLFSLCGDAMGRTALRGASQPALQKVRRKIRGAAQLAAKAKAKVKKCSKPRCRNNAASPRAKFCIGCFKDKARCTGARSTGGGNRGAKGVIGNRGAQGLMGNSGNTNSGQKKKVAGKRNAGGAPRRCCY